MGVDADKIMEDASKDTCGFFVVEFAWEAL